MERGAEGQEEKAVGKTCWGIPFITWRKTSYIPDLCSQFSLAWSLAQRDSGQKNPHPPGQSYWGPADKSLWGTLRRSPCQSPSLAPTAAHLFVGVQGNKKWETVRELRFCWARVLPAIGARTSRLTRRSSGVWDGSLQAFCELVFCCPGFQSAGLLVTSPALGFLGFSFHLGSFHQVRLLLCLASSFRGLSWGCFSQG